MDQAQIWFLLKGFVIHTNNWIKIIQRIFDAVMCLFHRYWDLFFFTLINISVVDHEERWCLWQQRHHKNDSIFWLFKGEKLIPVLTISNLLTKSQCYEPAVSQLVTEGQQSLAVTMEQVLKVPVAAPPDFCYVFLVVPVVSSVAEESWSAAGQLLSFLDQNGQVPG